MQHPSPKRIFYLIKISTGISSGFCSLTEALLIFSGLSKVSSEAPLMIGGMALTPLQWLALVVAIGTLLTALLEVPTGIFADALGRKFSILASMTCRCLSLFFLFLLALETLKPSPESHVVLFYAFGYEIFYAACYTFRSGSLVAWLVDSLTSEGKDNQRNFILSRGWTYNYFTLVFSILLSVLAYLTDLLHYVFLAGIVTELTVILFLSLKMQENRQYTFLRPSAIYREGMLLIRRELKQTWLIGWQTLSRSKILWIVFLTGASVQSIIDVTGVLWPVIAKSNFPGQLDEFSYSWIVLVAVLYTSSALGTLILSKHLFKKIDSSNSAKSTVLTSTFVFIGGALPLAFLAIFMSYQGLGLAKFNIFVGLLAISYLFRGSLFAMLEAMQNQFIEKNTQQRSTIISLGTMISHTVTALLFFIGAGRVTNNILFWLVPIGAIILCVSIQTPMCLRHIRHSQQKTSDQAA